MNTLGKIAMGLLIVCLLVATFFTVGVLKARSTWLTKIESKLKQIEGTEGAEEKLKSAKKQFEEARNLVHWENDNWGRAWQSPNSGPAGNDSIELGIGTNVGLGAGQQDPAKLPIVYLFGGNSEGKSVYVGDFQLSEIRQDSALGKLTRPAYANEVQAWPSGEYRVRQDVPRDFRSSINTLRTLAILAEQNVRQESAMLAIQSEHIIASQAALDERMGELNGKQDAPEKAGPDVKDGLVQTLRRDEADRNELVKTVDALRRELSDKNLLLTTTLADNQANIQKLSGPSGTEAPARRVATEKAKTQSN